MQKLEPTMINIELADKTNIMFAHGATGLEIARRISQSLAKEALVIKVNNELKDLSFQINSDATVKILTNSDHESLEVLRHDAAHIMAEAAKELFPEIQVTIGPAIENGFYYDFATTKPFTLEDMAKIEKKMHEIVKRNEQITRLVWNRGDAIKFFQDRGEHYKAEIIESIAVDQEISVYKQGDFIDLCRGPHGPSTAKVKYFKLMKIAGAYWRGDSKNAMLQRIYGTAWATAEQLESYLYMLEESEKRDHRKIGRELDLFHFQDEAQGMPFWHDKGWSIYRTIEQYIRAKIKKAGYIEVKTPVLLDKSLWEASGHWDKFRENMFALNTDDKVLALKPMNCPCHVQIFKHGTKSYRDLPLRMAEFGLCHRNEASGGLHGLMRVRALVQDDAHIFCTNDQVITETISFCQLLQNVYNDFGFNNINVKFADRPAVRAGSDEIWDKSEAALLEAVDAAGLEYSLNPGDGAFYGPKLEFHLRDAIGRDWQCGTLQVDFVLPKRLDATYIASNGEKKHPVMLHRAILGAFERFIGILIEEYAGKFPLWLAPTQVAILTITNDNDEPAIALHKLLLEHSIRSELDISAEKVNYKIRNFSNKKVPLIAVIGKQEASSGTVSLRKLGSNQHEIISIESLIELVSSENTKYL